MKEQNSNRAAGCGVGCLHYIATILFSLLYLSVAVLHKRRFSPQTPYPLEIFFHTVYSALEFPLMPLAKLIWHQNAEYSAFFLIWPLNSLMFGFGLVFLIARMSK